MSRPLSAVCYWLGVALRAQLRRFRPAGYGGFAEQLAYVFGSQSEADVHPHVPEERAHLFHAVDGGTTELEVLNFIHALVLLHKPRNVLETGTWRGMGTLTLAAALQANGNDGQVLSLDRDRDAHRLARRAIWLFDRALLRRISLHRADTLAFLSSCDGPPFDFAFLDSDERIRADELQTLVARGKLSSGAVCVIHDTSPHRARYTRPVEGLEAPGFERLECPLSRGVLCLRLKG